MTVQTHRIKRQVIELTVHDATAARRLHNEISRIYHQRIVPLIDHYCSELSTPDQLHRIETLVLDIGSITMLQLEADLVAQVEDALRPALAAQIGAQAPRSPDERPDLLAWLELFELFAHSGTLPWWADATAPRLLEDGMQHLLQQAPTPLARLMHRLAPATHALQRLVDHLPDALLAALAGELAPAVQAESADDLPTMVTLLQQSPVAAGHTPAWLRRHAWMTILQVAGIAGPQYTVPSFYQAVLQRLAAILGMPYASLLAAVRQGSLAAGLPGKDRLTHTLDSLMLQQPAGENAAPVAEPTAHDSLWTLLRLLAPRFAPSLRAELLVALDTHDSGQSPQVTARRILPLLQSDQARQALPVEEMRSILRMLQASVHAGPEQSATADEQEIDLSLSTADEIYIGNAGLVILWPFLSRFFARLDLLDGRQFKDHAARQRAVALLQHIATGEPACPEYLLPLNKLLCGLEPTDLFDMLEPLHETEMAECTNLLTAVIAQAPVLRDMSPSGFRGTFLLRPAMVSTRDGVWLLRVERQTYDIVLERFPWGWEWVKLPWMDAPLRVEW